MDCNPADAMKKEYKCAALETVVRTDILEHPIEEWALCLDVMRSREIGEVEFRTTDVRNEGTETGTCQVSEDGRRQIPGTDVGVRAGTMQATRCRG